MTSVNEKNASTPSEGTRHRRCKTLRRMNAATLLAGLRVLDVSIWRPGPYAASLLVALGADVVKVEPPGGDPMRHYPSLFGPINAGKRSIELDLKGEAGRSRAFELAAEADVLIEGFRPGVLARLGLGDAAVRAVNPGIVYCSISGYGQRDPRAALPGHDVNYQAWSGALRPEGGPGAMPPLPTADLAAGMTAAFGICAAVLGRTTTGEGTYLDVSMTDVLSTWTGPAGAAGDQGPGAGPRHGRADPVPGYGLFVTGDDGQIALGVLNEQPFWSGLCRTLGLDDEADLDFAARVHAARRCSTPSPSRSRRETGTSSSPSSWRPGFPLHPSSIAPACRPALRSRLSPSGSDCPTLRARCRRSTNTAERDSANAPDQPPVLLGCRP